MTSSRAPRTPSADPVIHTPGPIATPSAITGSSTTPLSSSRASRLSAVVGDGSFEQMMKERARMRKEKDEHSVAELRVQLTSMDRALSQEIKRRIDLNRTLEKQCAERVADMESRLTKMIDERAELVTARLEALESKVEELNSRFEEERERIPRDIERRGKELGDMLEQLQEELSAERRDRLGREGRIMKQLADHGDFVASSVQTEHAEREQAVSDLRRRIQTVEEGRAETDRRNSEQISVELTTLREGLEQEVNERKLEDDEIVDALNRYAEHLQASLSVMND
eukprot:CAMPEP_0183294322 /NCGR_PEP_ID=MMETSP0160_2-20130417/2714_1 /TAXON_ID=2839 ORGANISM="Odontella Sinensis, Strain Grunow 1884" /NCGR_SAMPLE_ID=MMETSP0160_2 /ASSEMBLY_ACC=CAM_ASM_000250 /LENGTH=283 /DNA_ID=CAMNT_0025455631 /DNA_START=115 /DNA_END=966 /DNA_ORIENTATION=-